MTRFVATFFAILVALFVAQLTPPAQHILVLPWTETLARISGGLIVPFDPSVTVLGKALTSSANGFWITIEAGCNGIEAAILLIAAILAFPAPWKYRLGGILIGLLAVQALNVVRVITLFYLGQWNVNAFEWAHLYIWQALIVVDVLIVWLAWIRILPHNINRNRVVGSEL